MVPQNFGVAKHPLFFIEDFVLQYFPKIHKDIFGSENLDHKVDENELTQEDVDAKAERRSIDIMSP